jgi:hypothetical protein
MKRFRNPGLGKALLRLLIELREDRERINAAIVAIEKLRHAQEENSESLPKEFSQRIFSD